MIWKERFRKVRSYLWEEVVERTSSPYNELLEVQYAYGRYMLNTRNVNYSFGHLDTVWRDAFREIKLEKRKFRTVLILGLGGGNIPRIIREYEARTGKEYQLTGVEIDPEVVRLGKKYFELDSYPRLEIVLADAKKFLLHNDQQFDLVAVDLFIDDVVPKVFEQSEMLLLLRNALSSQGVLLFNRLNLNEEIRNKTAVFIKKMQETLPGTRYFKAHENTMLCYENQSI